MIGLFKYFEIRYVIHGFLRGEGAVTEPFTSIIKNILAQRQMVSPNFSIKEPNRRFIRVMMISALSS